MHYASNWLVQVPPIHYLDATSDEEAATSLQLLLAFSFRNGGGEGELQAMRLLGTGELPLEMIKRLLVVRLHFLQH